MSRLDASYRHFFADGFTYKHVWQNYKISVTNVSGDTITSNASLIAGALETDNFLAGETFARNVSLTAGTYTADGNASGIGLLDAWFIFPGQAEGSIGGQTLDFTITLFEGITSSDGSAPLNTRLNATYRHFWGRGQTWRHIWQQWEGVLITPVGGLVVLIALALVEVGEVSADANVEGQELTATCSLIAGDAAVHNVVFGEEFTVDASLIAGAVAGDANVNGVVLTVSAQILSGIFIPGQIITAHASLIDGVVTITSIAAGELLPVDVILEPGEATGGAHSDGADLEVECLLLPGQPFAGGDVLASGDTITVLVRLIEGEASAPSSSVLVIGQELTVNVTVVPGTVTITPDQIPSTRHGGPIGYHRKEKPHVLNAQVFGTMIVVRAQAHGGTATGEHAWVPVEPLQPARIEPTPPSERSREIVAELLRTGIASANVQVEGATFEHKDWTKYDNELLELI